jgi:hypothetical protein
MPYTKTTWGVTSQLPPFAVPLRGRGGVGGPGCFRASGRRGGVVPVPFTVTSAVARRRRGSPSSRWSMRGALDREPRRPAGETRDMRLETGGWGQWGGSRLLHPPGDGRARRALPSTPRSRVGAESASPGRGRSQIERRRARWGQGPRALLYAQLLDGLTAATCSWAFTGQPARRRELRPAHSRRLRSGAGLGQRLHLGWCAREAVAAGLQGGELLLDAVAGGRGSLLGGRSRRLALAGRSTMRDSQPGGRGRCWRALVRSLRHVEAGAMPGR